MNALEERIGKLAARMTMTEPFIASVFTKLPREVLPADNKLGITTAGANGTKFYFNEEFCSPLNDEELFGLCLHEAMHVVFMHMWRRESRNPFLWNIATDAVINFLILQRGKGYQLPKGGVNIPWVNDEMDTEVVYNKLMQDASSGKSSKGKGNGNGKGGQQGSGGNGDPDYSDLEGEGEYGKGGFDGQGDLMDAESEADRVDMEATIMAAAKMAKACGDKSALIDRVLGGALDPLVNWADELRAMMTSASRDDYTYRRVNRRMLSQGVYLPSLYSEAMGGLVIGVDTSGSVGHSELERIAAEIRGIVANVNPEFVEVVYCDSRVAGTQRFNRGEEVILKAKGGGGTAFKPVFDYVETMNEPISALIYLTDMCGDLDFGPAPDYPVLWGNIYGDMGSRIKFGKELRIYV